MLALIICVLEYPLNNRSRLRFSLSCIICYTVCIHVTVHDAEYVIAYNLIKSFTTFSNQCKCDTAPLDSTLRPLQQENGHL